MRKNGASGFTLIEILVVLGISMILLGLILGPIIQSFGLTRRAQVMVSAQNTARLTLDKISREISEAMFVYDNTQSPINFPIPIWEIGKAPDDFTIFKVYGAKIDLVLPRMIMHCNDADHPDGYPRDYERGKTINGRFYAEAWPSCPICGSDVVEARPASPRQPDDKIVRYFIGLLDNDPSHYYINGYDRDSGAYSVSEPDNTFVLYRAEFSLSDDRLYPSNLSDPKDRIDYLMNNSNFFYDTRTSASGNNIPVWQQWKKIAQVVGPKEDIDLVRIKWQKDGKRHSPVQVSSAVSFAPAGVDNDALSATYVSDANAELPNATPTMFRASHGLWCPGFRVVVYTNDLSTYYNTAYNSNNDLCVYKNGTDQVFNIDQYHRDPAAAMQNDPELMFTVDPDKGSVSFAFPGSASLSEQDINGINDYFKQEYQDSLEVDGRGQGVRGWVLAQPPGFSKIVPGTETLTGPDMMPGSHYGLPTRYTRVPWNMGDPGRNQYKINYNTGELQFSSLWEEDIPEVSGGAINITYRFHNNKPDMVLKADYATKMLISINLAMRLYDDSSGGKLQVVELSNRIRLRNAMR